MLGSKLSKNTSSTIEWLNTSKLSTSSSSHFILLCSTITNTTLLHYNRTGIVTSKPFKKVHCFPYITRHFKNSFTAVSVCNHGADELLGALLFPKTTNLLFADPLFRSRFREFKWHFVSLLWNGLLETAIKTWRRIGNVFLEDILSLSNYTHVKEQWQWSVGVLSPSAYLALIRQASSLVLSVVTANLTRWGWSSRPWLGFQGSAHAQFLIK